MASSSPSLPVVSHAFPRLDELSWRTRLSISASASADVALRTAAAALVSTTIGPFVLDRDASRRDAARLGWYRDLVERHDDPREIFPAPPPDIRVEVTSDAPLPRTWAPGRLRALRFDSPYVPLHPKLRVSYLDHRRNRTAWAQHWTHADGPRPTLVVVHGFMASPYWVNRAFFQLPWFYGHGYDICLVTLPFHGRRRDAPWHYSGEGLFGGGFSHLTEAMAHALYDLRAWLDHLFAAGAPQVGITGLSLGGYLSSLLSSVDDRLSFAIPNVPVTSLADIVESWAPAGWVVEAGLRRAGVTIEQLRGALALTSPLTWPALVPHDRRFIIAGLGDRLAPPSHARALWRHWDQPQVHWFPGNHVLHLERGAYLRQMGRFLQAVGFAG